MWCDVTSSKMKGRKEEVRCLSCWCIFIPVSPQLIAARANHCQIEVNLSKCCSSLYLRKKIQEEKNIYIKWNQENSCNLCKASYGVREIKWRIKFDWIYEKKSMNWRDTKIGFKIMMLFKLNHLTKKLSTFNWMP